MWERPDLRRTHAPADQGVKRASRGRIGRSLMLAKRCMKRLTRGDGEEVRRPTNRGRAVSSAKGGVYRFPRPRAGIVHQTPVIGWPVRRGVAEAEPPNLPGTHPEAQAVRLLRNG